MMDAFILRALVAGLGVAVIAGPLGSFVVWGRMAFFGAAIAHSALLGVALGILLDVSPMAGIVAVSVVMAVSLVALQQRKGIATDTLLGILAHGALAVGLVVLAFMEGARVDLLGYLFGDILAVTDRDLVLIWGIALVAFVVLARIWRPLLSILVHEDLARVEGVPVTRDRLALMLLIALVIAISIKLVGLLLITSLLIIPAATARRFARTPMQMAATASAIGCLSILAGLWGAFTWDTPAGPSIVVAAVGAFALVRLWPAVSPGRPR